MNALLKDLSISAGKMVLLARRFSTEAQAGNAPAVGALADEITACAQGIIDVAKDVTRKSDAKIIDGEQLSCSDHPQEPVGSCAKCQYIEHVWAEYFAEVTEKMSSGEIPPPDVRWAPGHEQGPGKKVPS